jgi:drug/metabolite transporter (DMT)-like permease
MSPQSPADALVFLGLGIFGGFGHYFIVRAFELAPAPFVSPFNYAQIIGAALLSLAVFGHLPDVWTWLGALIITGSGLYMLATERRGKRLASKPPRDGDPS